MRLSEAIESFKEWRGFKVTGHTVIRYDHVLRIFCLCMHDPEVREIKLGHILYYLQALEKLGWKRNGITIVALALRKFFEFCNLLGMRCLNESLIPLPRKEFNMPRVADKKDFHKLVGAIGPKQNANNLRNRALISLIWDSWARSGEVVSLNEDDLVFNKNLSGHATIKTEKSRGRRPIRQIFWTPQTGRYLKSWLRKKHHLEKYFQFDDEGALFVSINKSGLYDSRGRRMTNRGVAEMLRMLSNRARLNRIFNAHSMRHYGGREIIKKGGSNADVSNLLGHSHLDSSMIYTMMWNKDLESRYRKFKGQRNKRLTSFVGALARKLEHQTDGGGKMGRV